MSSITIPQNAEYVGENAFAGSNASITWYYNESVQTDNFKNYIKEIYIMSHIEEIPDNAFREISTLERVSFSEGRLKRIGKYAFAHTNCSIINLPQSLESIGEYAFLGCRKLTSINIPKSVSVIEQNAFLSCGKLTIDASDFKMSEIPGGWHPQWNPNNLTVVYKSTGTVIYDGTTVVGFTAGADFDGNVVIKAGTKKIVGNVFYETNIKTILLPDGLEEIVSGAFTRCFDLQTINFPSSVIKIGGYAFDSCRSLTNIVLPDNITVIEYRAFSGCSKLESLKLPSNLVEIKSYAFEGCSNLQSIEIPVGVTKIGNYAFMNCRALSDIDFKSSVLSIDSFAFHSSGLTYFQLPQGIKHIGSYAFASNRNLVAVTIPSGIETMGSSVFSGCDSLMSIMIPSSMDMETSVFANPGTATIYVYNHKKADGTIQGKWDTYWNSSNRPVVFGCHLSSDNMSIAFVIKTQDSIINPSAVLGIKPPYKKGYTFSGWAGSNGTIYRAGEIHNAPNGTTLYSIWTKF